MAPLHLVIKAIKPTNHHPWFPQTHPIITKSCTSFIFWFYSLSSIPSATTLIKTSHHFLSPKELPCLQPCPLLNQQSWASRSDLILLFPRIKPFSGIHQHQTVKFIHLASQVLEDLASPYFSSASLQSLVLLYTLVKLPPSHLRLVHICVPV